MSNVYFAYDSVIELDEAESFSHLIHIAASLMCQLRIAGDVDMSSTQTEEGYIKNRYVVCAPSKSVFDTFLQSVRKQTGYTDWFPVTEEYYHLTLRTEYIKML